MSKRLMPTYLVNFLKEIYDGTIPSNFGKRMVSRQFIASVKELYETLGGDNPSDYSRRMVNEYLIKFFNEIEIVEYTDDDVLMTKTIPSDLVYPACRIDSIGGMSYKSENLIVLNDKAQTTTSGITYSIKDGVLTLNGTASSYGQLLNITLNNVDGYFKMFIDGTTTGSSGYSVTHSGGTSYNANGYYTGITSIEYWFNSGDVFTNRKYSPMLVSGSTAPTEYKQGFTGIRDSIITSIKSYDSNNNLIDTYTIPAKVQALEGYGQGINSTVYNNVDFASGKYTKKVGVVDLGTLNYTYISQYNYFIIETNIGAKLVNSSTTMNALCEKYKPISQIYFQSNDKVVFVVNSANVCIKDTDYTNATIFKTAMDGVLLYYELNTPVETTISENAPLLEVESGGTVVLDNEYNNDVPSEVVTWIKES